ncbi:MULTISPECIES: cation-translocating P-type ATPase [unclassified Spiroplasma]|uniref:heavy metal translocating P-type ATPase n=1 Tax=unclassified Spiroplasma TaxID=2637901 RepID=UPI00313AB26E
MHLTHTDKQHRWFEIKEILRSVFAILLVIPMWISMGKVNPLAVYFGNPIIQLMLASIVQFILGFNFYKAWYQELFQQRRVGMYSLIILSSLVAFIYSIYLIVLMLQYSPYGKEHIIGLFQGISHQQLMNYMMIDNKFQHMYFEIGASIIAFVLVGDTISQIVRNRAIDGLQDLMSLQVKEATIFKENNKYVTIAAIDIKIDDQLLVKKGDKIPTDGILMGELAYINDSLITGESQIVKKMTGELLIGGSANAGEAFIMRATKIGNETILASIINKVEQLQQQKTNLQKIADKIAAIFVPFVLGLALLVFLVYAFILPLFDLSFIMSDPYGIAIKTAISTLIIACPCALGLATPLAITVGIAKSTQEGIIFNKVHAFEKINQIDIVAFDKTGTVTDGKLSIKAIYGEEKHITFAVSLENMSAHPIATAFKAYQEAYNISKVSLTDVKETIGFGIQGLCNKQRVTISSVTKLLEKKFVLAVPLQRIVEKSKEINQLVLGLAIDKVIVTLFVLEDQIKLNAIKTVAKLKQEGIEVYMISGDNEVITRGVATAIGIEHYFANIQPLDKANIIKKLQKQGKKVAFVGDGVNDSVALQQADLSIAMGTGAEIAVNLSDIIIIKPDVLNIYKAIVLTKQIRRVIWTNFMWAFGYNLIALPVAMLSGWFWISIPNFEFAIFAAAAMAFSDLTVVLNSLYYRWKKIKY